MKIEVTENSVKLIAETNFEEEALARLKRKGVESIQYEDAWNQRGPLILTHARHPWDIPGHPGGR